MKLASHITCIFAILSQIFLSSIAFAHDVTCQSSNSFSPIIKGKQIEAQHTHSCSCCHSHQSSNPVSELSDSDTLGESLNTNNLPAPCTCSSEPASSFVAGDYSIETRERIISLIAIASIDNGLSFLTLPNTPSLNGVLASIRDRIGLKGRIKLIHLAQYSGRFVSTHLSKFLL